MPFQTFSGLINDLLHLSLFAALADLVRDVPVAVTLLREALAAPVARVRLLTEVQERVVYPVAHFGELMAALAACQDLVLAPGAVVDCEGAHEHSFDLETVSRSVRVVVVVLLVVVLLVTRLHAISALLIDIVLVHAVLFIW